MGLYDVVTFEADIDVEFPALYGDPHTVSWQTKSIARGHPMMDMYRVTDDGRLLKEDAEYETVPEEERPRYDPEEGFESEFERMIGSRRKVHQEWSDTEYHGTFEFHRTIDGEYVSLEAKFTDGQLVEVTRND